ncbi:Phosphatidylinositol-4-phosphate 5-kinase core [Macrophomina phaseolina MS6]|uniref:Phosphatidylinositol-4-phosphate 5-kinase core n=1 Tax=Macrophomina phaseolina (strain MS6) TaxID=1126212 RepID=K2SMR2_MACPH|nr:Phosphatidylinositol-4-phosphate 5-kinase core [Macrophomina phaseolina MS6]
MGLRTNRISKAILRAIFNEGRDDTTSPNARPSLLARILAFFSLFAIALRRFRAADFTRLRRDAWHLDDAEYRESFRLADRRGGALNPVGDLGYSGSTFFTTPNAKFLVKSLPRRFEYAFFAHDLLDPYLQHMHAYPNSLLVRITDFLEAIAPSLGGSLLGTAPAHHVVMENVLFGKDADAGWETYDLKPASYFYPERDIAGGRLAPESVKERLVDKFPDKVRVTPAQRDELLAALGADTELLRRANAVDYSLFLVRYPAQPEREIPAVKARTSAWREGVRSVDGRWVYRAVVLDFFWAKHKTQPQLMTKLVKSFNFFARKGPMSITTSPDEYRSRFLKMVKGYVEDGTEQQE